MLFPAVRDFDIWKVLEAQLPRTLKGKVTFGVATDPYFLRTIVTVKVPDAPGYSRQFALELDDQGYSVKIPENYLAELTLVV